MKTNTQLLHTAVFMAATLSSFSQPSFTVQPADQTANQGFSAMFRVVAQGTAPLNYEWFFQSNAIPSATTNVLTITNAQPVNAGSYFVVVTNSTGSVTSRVATLTITLPVPLNTKLGTNIRMGDDLPELPTTHLHEGCPHIARSYFDPNLLIATFQDHIGSDREPRAGGYSVSGDGGLTWTRAFIPGLTKVTGGEFDGAGDNVAAIDLNGNPFLLSLCGSNAIFSGQFMAALVINKRLEAGGLIFGPPRVLEPVSTAYFADKGWIGINTFPGSLTSNRLVVSFNRNGSRDGGSNRLYSIYSDDAGDTWSQPQAIGPPRDAYAPQVFFLPDATLAIVYRRYLSGFHQTASNHIELALSKNGGATFDPSFLVKDMTGLHYEDPIAASPGFHSACADRQTGVIYVALQAQTGAGTNRASRILFTKSIDQGKTWTTAVAVNDTPARKSVFNATITVSPDGQHVTITFYDKRNQTATSGNNLYDLYLAESFDGGDAWEPNIRLSDFSSDLRQAPIENSKRWIGEYQGIVPALNLQTPGVAVWIDSRGGNLDPYVVRITRTKGTTFDTWRKLRFSTNDLANPALSGENGDPDGDGISNLAEYAFGLELTRADASPLKIIQAAPGFPAMVTASYERLAVLSDIQFSWHSSADLVAWTPVNPAPEQVASGRDPAMQRVEASFSTGDQMRFFRLGVSRLPPNP